MFFPLVSYRYKLNLRPEMSEGCQLFCQVALECGYTKFWCPVHRWAAARWPFPSKMVNCGTTAVEDQYGAAAAIDVQSLKWRYWSGYRSGVCMVHLRSQKNSRTFHLLSDVLKKKYFHPKTPTMLKLNKAATEKGSSTCSLEMFDHLRVLQQCCKGTWLKQLQD